MLNIWGCYYIYEIELFSWLPLINLHLRSIVSGEMVPSFYHQTPAKVSLFMWISSYLKHAYTKYFDRSSGIGCYKPFWRVLSIWCPKMESAYPTKSSIIIFKSPPYSSICRIIVCHLYFFCYLLSLIMSWYWCLITGIIVFCVGGLATYLTHKTVVCRYPYFIGGGSIAIIIYLIILYLI